MIFLIATTVTSLFFVGSHPQIAPVLFLMLGFGLIGFLDDYLKVVLHRSDGLLPWQKMLCQIIVTGIFVLYDTFFGCFPEAAASVLRGLAVDIGWLAVPLLFIAVIGTVNAVNFTDGLDGLASSVTVIVAVFFSVVAVGRNTGLEPITCAVVGSLMGFLVFNVFPAKIFMGDTGSLAPGRLCGRCGLYDEHAAVHPYCGTDLCGGASLRHASGYIF